MTHGSITPENPVRLVPVDTTRKLHIGHFAFMRALIQGTDTKAAWERYLQIEGEHSDVRTARRTIAWIRDAFAAAARREHRFGTARLVLADWSKVGNCKQQQLTLDQFVADRGLEGFSEADQIVAFSDAYPALKIQQKRRAKLMAKQLDALRWLEELAAQPPAAGDPIVSWLHPDLAGHLQASSLFTLRQLVNHINGIGKRWYASIPAIGPLKAKRIEDWLRVYELSIGMTLGRHITVARKKLYNHGLARLVPRQTGIVPIDKLIVPSELDGSQGTFRAAREHCMMRAYKARVSMQVAKGKWYPFQASVAMGQAKTYFAVAGVSSGLSLRNGEKRSSGLVTTGKTRLAVSHEIPNAMSPAASQ